MLYSQILSTMPHQMIEFGWAFYDLYYLSLEAFDKKYNKKNQK